MIRWSIWVIVLLTFGGCKTPETVTERTQQVAQRYELLLKFASLEDVKRVPYRFSHLKMELMEEVSPTDNIYRVSVLCKEYEIVGIVTKLNHAEGISWVKRAS